MIKVIIADDCLFVRKGIRAILEREPGISVIGEASNGQETLDLTERLSPDVLVLDIEMPVMDGFTALKILRKGEGNLSILILSATKDPFVVDECMNNGAHGYILKEDAPGFLVSAVQRASHGEGGINSPGAQENYDTLDEP